MTDHNELVNRYRQFRQITRKLHSRLPEYLSKRAFNECGKKLGIMKNNTLVFNDEEDMAVLMDYCLYDYRENGINAVSRHLADSKIPADSDEYKVLKAMSESFYTLVQVEDVLPGAGVRVDDLFADKQFLLIDIGFSMTAKRGVIIATRILPFEDFVMTSGAALPIDAQTLSEIFDFVMEHYDSENIDYVDLDMHDKSELTATIIRFCLRNDANSRIFYDDVPQDLGIEPVTAPLRADPHIGRNEPCPCGSGKKYKRCCGR